MDGFAYDTYTGPPRSGESTDPVHRRRHRSADKNDAFFGEKQLEQHLSAHCGESAQQLVACVHAAVQEFANGEPQADDITVLALRYVGQALPPAN